ncbi:thiamine pyrophosphokinase [bacterium BMS3Abin02]|nr:thiamine pyrophosphokinase [bacterium BMS3Abin02]GBE22517.1 thiamine pyrophosphokinase [bacterium BMS3Bbin01]HDH26240.1 thiamine diphosphokinase [Actinomycetota bacterium]HDK45118.1 thiamine diphosphokinase [Actinomycetota bacterium]HDL50103.1 thiamine diphosphokinase [Actinomycetota bacterium]
MSDTAIIISGGGEVPAAVADGLPTDAYVIAADSGLDLAAALGIRVDVVIGDLDSVSATVLEAAKRRGTRVRRHPVDKDATDLELAMTHAREKGVSSVIVIGGHGGRMDHFLANASLLAAQTGLDVEWRTATSRAHRVNGTLRLHGSPGEMISLLAFGGPAKGVRTSGLRWPLHGEDLQPDGTRGMSNRFVEEQAEIVVADGNLLVVLPER